MFVNIAFPQFGNLWGGQIAESSKGKIFSRIHTVWWNWFHIWEFMGGTNFWRTFQIWELRKTVWWNSVTMWTLNWGGDHNMPSHKQTRPERPRTCRGKRPPTMGYIKGGPIRYIIIAPPSCRDHLLELPVISSATTYYRDAQHTNVTSGITSYVCGTELTYWWIKWGDKCRWMVE